MDLFIDHRVTKHLREVTLGLFDHKCYHLAQARLFTESIQDVKLLVFFCDALILRFMMIVCRLKGNDNFAPHVTYTLDEFPEDLHFGFDAAELSCEDSAGLVENFVGNAKVLVGFVHGFTDVVGCPVEFPSEEMIQLKLKKSFFLWVPKLFVIASKLSVCHDSVQEKVDKQLQFCFSTQLLVKAGVLVRDNRDYRHLRLVVPDITHDGITMSGLRKAVSLFANFFFAVFWGKICESSLCSFNEFWVRFLFLIDFVEVFKGA